MKVISTSHKRDRINLGLQIANCFYIFHIKNNTSSIFSTINNPYVPKYNYYQVFEINKAKTNRATKANFLKFLLSLFIELG